MEWWNDVLVDSWIDDDNMIWMIFQYWWILISKYYHTKILHYYYTILLVARMISSTNIWLSWFGWVQPTMLPPLANSKQRSSQRVLPWPLVISLSSFFSFLSFSLCCVMDGWWLGLNLQGGRNVASVSLVEQEDSCFLLVRDLAGMKLFRFDEDTLSVSD